MKKFDTVLKAENLEIAVKTNRLLLTAKTPEIMFNKASIVDETLPNPSSSKVEIHFAFSVSKSLPVF